MIDKKFIFINEVGLRDGLQSIPKYVTIDKRLKIVGLLIEAGLKHIQVCSFVNPRKIPQMADVERFARKLPKYNNVRYSAFILNQKGLDRAFDCGLTRVETSISLSETYSQKNMGRSIDVAKDELRTIISNAFDLKIGIRAGLQCVWGCGYEGKIKKKHVLQLVETILKTGVKNFCLADTIGSATPQNVESLLEEIIKNFPEIEITLHLHTNSGLELDNFKVGLQMGVRKFDTSFGGIGGSPFMTRSKGNIATEEAIYELETLGYDCDIDINKVSTASRTLEKVVDSKYFYGELYKFDSV